MSDPQNDDDVKAPAGDETTTSGNAELARLKEENARMQAKLDELLSETKKAKEAKREAEEEAKRASEDKAKRENDFEQLYKSAQERINALEAERQASLEAQKQSLIKTEAAKLAGTLTKDTAKAELLAEKFANRLAVSENGVQVLDESGNLTVSSLDELIGSVKSKYAFLVDAGSSGGGATGANGGAVKSTKKFNEMTGAELSALRRENPSEYARLKSDYYG